MSAVYLRGGIPRHVTGTTAIATAQQWLWSGGVANHLWFQNTGTGAIVLSFTADDAAADRGISVAAGADYLLPAEIADFYTKSAAAETFQAVVFIRRG